MALASRAREAGSGSRAANLASSSATCAKFRSFSLSPSPPYSPPQNERIKTLKKRKEELGQQQGDLVRREGARHVHLGFSRIVTSEIDIPKFS